MQLNDPLQKHQLGGSDPLYVFDLAWNSIGDSVFASSSDNCIRLLDIRSFQDVASILHPHSKAISCIEPSLHDPNIVTCSSLDKTGKV
jgi:WD40 repeat protein